MNRTSGQSWGAGLSRRMRGLFALVVLGSLASGVAAEVVSYPLSDGSGKSLFNLPKFDASLGTLKEVTLEARFNWGSTVESIPRCPDGADACDSLVQATSKGFVDFELGTIDLHLLSESSLSRNCPITNGYNQCGLFLGVHDADADSATDAETLALFTGPGTFRVFFDGPYVAVTSGLRDARRITGNPYGSWVTVTYAYDAVPTAAVPEPSSLALVALAGALVAWPRRRPRA